MSLSKKQQEQLNGFVSDLIKFTLGRFLEKLESDFEFKVQYCNLKASYEGDFEELEKWMKQYKRFFFASQTVNFCNTADTADDDVSFYVPPVDDVKIVKRIDKLKDNYLKCHYPDSECSVCIRKDVCFDEFDSVAIIDYLLEKLSEKKHSKENAPKIEGDKNE